MSDDLNLFREVMAWLTIALTFVAFYPYVRSILRGQTRPHAFSWVIWGLTTCIAFAAQVAGGGGAGAWPTGISGLVTFYVAYQAYRAHSLAHGTRSSTHGAQSLARRTQSTGVLAYLRSLPMSDWGFLAAALLALPAWWFTTDPWWAVVILTTVDLIGFGPTVRKGFAEPHEEQLAFFVLVAVRSLVSIAALEVLSWTTILFPAAIALASLLFVLMVWVRRTHCPALAG